MNDAKSSAWNDFWALQHGQASTGCLPARWQSVFAALEATWRSVADGLPEGARVLDLATGDARVLHWIGETRPDSERTGIDLATSLPPPPPGVRTLPGISMEALPFDDAQFDAVVSQFGVEYGDVPRVASEVARVCKPGGMVAFVVHRGDGAILAHNLARAAQVGWVLGEAQVFARARDGIGTETRPWPDTVATIAAAVAEGRERFGDQSAGWEIPEAVRRSLVMGAGANDSEAGVLGLLDRIEQQANNELARIESLRGACATADDRETFTGAFAEHGIGLRKGEVLKDAAGRVFAEALTFRKA